MGNVNSEEETEDQFLQGSVGEDSSVSGDNLLDFSSLFQPDALYKALLTIKQPSGSAVSKNKDGLVRWLSGLADADEHTVNMVQVVEYLTGKGVSKEEALEFYSEVDRDGEGQVDIAYLLMILKEKAVDPMQALVPCHMLPGPLEVYLPDKGSYSEAGRKLVQFLQARRVEPSCLGVGWMNQILAYQLTREKLVQGRYQMLFQAEEEGEEGEDDCGMMERQVISKCYSKIDTSTSQNQIKHLTDNRTDTYWQSNGSPRSHWIRLCILPGVTVREMAVSVDSNDDSYMPHTIVVSVGNAEKQLTEIKTVYVPRDRTGQVVLVKNLGRVYRYIQINIRSCHSDGCDVKIRGLHVKGSKMQELKQPSVLDTMTMWYISILGSTAKAAIPVAPQLRDSIISQSRLYLGSLQPLVLSPTSSARPEFLSSFVIQEMENMLKSLSLPEETYVSVSAECLEILLTFSIAHGSVNSILDCLHILLDNQNVELNVHNLLLKMESVKNTKYLNHAEAVQLNVASCSGGCKDDNHKVDNIIKNVISNTSATPYISSASLRTVTVVLREKNDQIFLPTRLVVQVPSTDNAASFCLFFLLDDDPKKEWLEQLTNYKGWGQEEYSKWLEETKGKDGSGLIAAAQFSKEKLQMDISPDVLKSGRSLVLVLCGSGEGVEGVAVQALSVFGHCITDKLQQSTSFLQQLDTVAPLPPEGGVIGGVVLCRVLVFLSALLQDLSKLMEYRRVSSMDPSHISEPHLAVEGLSLEKIWNLFIPLTLTPDGQADYAALLTLWLLRSALPFIKPDKKTAKAVTTSSQKSDGDPLKVSSAVLSHLCALLDAEEGAEDQSVVKNLAEDIVVKGVVVFFPDATARKEYLLSMIESVLNEKQPRSWWLKFEALCQYFSNTDANSLLGLPKRIKEGETPETGRALDLLSTVLTVATRESQMSLHSGKSRPDDLVHLLCALQASLFFWCRKNVDEANAQQLLLSYVDKLVTESRKILKVIAGIETDKEEKMMALQKSLLSRTLAEMLVFLPTIVESPVSRPRLMDILYPLVPALHAATSSSPSIFLRLSEAGSNEDHKESVVGVWTRESSHNYENNARVAEEFVCPLASKFVVEFDSRCITERRYDYLEFTDVHGVKHRFDGKVNSDRWSQTAEFPGPKLQFMFHSDGSNNEWGYLFTLKAYGQQAPSLHWLFDLQLSVARLFGQLISATLSMKTLYAHLPEQQSEEQREEALLTRSDLWKTLFRGGYMVGKLTRSLSGAHTASPSDSSLNMLLQDVANSREDRGKVLLDSLREKLKAPYYGGELVDRAVNSVFAALVWHCQDLREELAPQLALSESLHPSQLLQDAFSTAEALRRELVEARQKILEAIEKEESKEKRSKMNEDAPLIACHEKAVFLLKFAGLSRVAQDEVEEGLDEADGNPTLSPSWPRRSSQHWHKVSNAISTVGKLKQQLSLGGQVKPRKKPLSFELVLSFVKNESATVDKVHRLLKEREKVASCVAQAYTSAATYLSAHSIDNMFELPGLVFLQQLISKQRHFPNHYAAKLDGCGLELENQVRRAYRMLLQRLLEGLSAFSRSPSGEYSRARLLVSVITCHLLDFQWQDYDHRLLADLELPDFLLQSAITSTHSEEKESVERFKDEEAMLTRYSLHMAFQEAMGPNLAAIGELELYRDNKWEGDLFISARKMSGEVTVQCDGCEKVIENGVFYHNMDLKTTSYDLCPVCFKSGSGSRPEDHKPDQLYQALGCYYCDICNLTIISHRFHSNTRKNFDLCLGCFRKEEAKGSTDNWSVFLLTEVPSTESANRYVTYDPRHSKPLLYQDGYITRVGPALDLMVYQQQHCWILFTALCLSMAHFLHTKHTSPHEQDYKSQACRNHLQCLKNMSVILRTAVLAKWEEQEKKLVEKREKKEGEDDIKGLESDEKEEPVMSPHDQETAPNIHELTPSSMETTNEGMPTSMEATPTANEATPTEAAAPEAESPLPEEEDPITVASRLRWQRHTNTTSMEKTFSSLSISRTLYTLSAVLPQDMSLSVWQEGGGEVDRSLAEELLPALLEVATCTPIQPLPRQLAYLVSAQYMARVNPEVADHAIHMARRLGPDQPVQNVDSTESHGLVTTKYFFSLGAGFLHKSDFGGAATIAECLLVLSKSTQWKKAVSQSVFSPLHTRAEEMDLSSIFGLMVLAGFPKLHREGSLVRVHSSDSDPHQQPLSVLTSVEGESGNVVSSLHREPKTVKLSQCEVEDNLQGCITSSQLQFLLPLLQQSMQLAKREDGRQVEATWILALVLKALLTLLKGPESKEVVKTVMKENLLPSITRLACKATRLRQRWLASDLEVLAIRGYQPLLPGKKADVTEVNHESKEMTEEEGEGEKKREGKGEEDKREEDKREDKGEEDKREEDKGEEDKREEDKREDEKEKEASRRSEEACLEGLSDEIQDMLVIMQEAFQCPLATLRALFDASGADVNQFIMSSEQYYDMESATLKPPDDIVEAAKKWETELASAQHEVKDIQDSLEDTGVTRLVPVPFSPSTLEAEPEKDDVMKRPKSSHLMQEDSTHQLQDKEGTGREDSFQLLQEKIKEGVISRKQLLETQQAIVVLYARHLLAALLSQWPQSPHPLFSTSLLGNLDIMQFFCLLDLLMKPLNNHTCSNLLEVLVSCTEPTQIRSLAVTASECMRKVSVGTEKKQFRHPATGTLEEKGTVVIPNASSMSVVFHQTRGEVELSSKEDLSDHHKSLSHSETNTLREVTHLIPGNTVCYKVALKGAKEAKYPPCTLTITGTQMGRFSTGLKFLERLLKAAGEGENGLLAKSIPLSKLWCNLIAVACQHTGHERLKVIHLLLQLLTMMKDSALPERPDLSVLKPLWQLYTTLMKDYDAKSRSQQLLAPEIVRALTELFLAVENQAEEWGVSQIMMIETLTKEGLGTWLEKGISNVAFLSLGLGLDNTASRAFIEAKRSYVPPSEEGEEEEEEEEEEVDHGSSSDDDSSSSSLSESEDSFDSED